MIGVPFLRIFHLLLEVSITLGFQEPQVLLENFDMVGVRVDSYPAGILH